MAVLKMWNLQDGELEDVADTAKMLTLRQLVKDGLLDEKEADEWGQKHGCIIRRRSIFRSLSNRWEGAGDDGEAQWIMVKLA